MLRRIIFFLLLLFAVVVARAAEIPDDEDPFASDLRLTSSSDLAKDEVGVQREEALEKLQQIFGIPGQNDRSNHHKIPPQFMMELYNTIADPSGVTRGKNPYNAKVVRSFIERDSSLSHYYLFNISGLEVNESVLEAELHLYRKRTPLKAIHPTVLSSPYYLIRVYQVLNEQHLDTPDLHRLLNVHYVGAHASGWQVFNVKQAVLSWVSGTPNLGLLVTASTLFGDEVSVDFSRRNEYHHSKQPILVLFDDDGKECNTGENITPQYYKYNDLEDEEDVSYKGHKIDLEDEYDNERFERRKRHEGDLEDIEEDDYEDTHEKSQKVRRQAIMDHRNTDREEFDEKHDNSDIRELIDGDIIQNPTRYPRESKMSKKNRRIVTKNTKIAHTMSSIDIYDRAMLREKLAGHDKHTKAESQNPFMMQNRHKRSTKRRTHAFTQPNTTECARHELYVDFEEIGWSSFIIAPKGYSAYHCKGHCNFPLSQNQRPTNHATVQSIVNKLSLANDVEQPCCVPTKLLSSSILYFDDHDNVILKMYEDMVADRCGCH